MNKNIMFVMNQMTSGGAERVVSILANSMSERGNRVSLVITFNSEIHYEINNKIEIIKFNINKELSQVSRNIKEIKSLIKLLKEKRPDVIISFIRNVNCIVAAKIVGIPVIISERNNPKYDPKSKVWRVLRKIIYPYADGIVFQTNGARKYFSKKIQENSIIIENPLDESIKETIKCQKKKQVISVGRLCKQKDQETLIKAFHIFVKENKDYKLIIYGEGELREKLENLILNLGLSEYVELFGSTKDIYEKMIQSELFVMSSIYEGYPNALIEAMALGLPVISTDCMYGPSEVIENGVNGILVKVGDYKNLANEMLKIIKNNDFREKIIENTQKNNLIFNKEIIVDKWLKYINIKL